MSARHILLAWVLSLLAVVIVAMSDDDPEGLAVGPQHLEQIMREECAAGTRAACDEVREIERQKGGAK